MVLGANTFLIPYLNSSNKIKKVLPQEDTIYMVPKPLQKLSGDSLAVSTVATPLGIMSLIPMCPMS